MSTRPNVTVLLAAYNGASFIDVQLQSIVDQAGVTCEIVIRLDPSTDDTQQIIDRWTATNPMVSQISSAPEPARGAAQNFYTLMATTHLPAHAEFVALADQDDVWYPDKLAMATTYLRDHKIDGFSSDVDVWDNAKGTFTHLTKSQPQRSFDHLFSSAGPGCTYVLSRRLFLDFQRWLRSHRHAVAAAEYHDWLIYAWAREHGYEWHIDDRPSLAYRQHTNNQLGANSGLGAAWSRARAVRGGWYLHQALLIMNLLNVHATLPRRAVEGNSIRDKLIAMTRVSALRRAPRDQVAMLVALALCHRPHTPLSPLDQSIASGADSAADPG